MKPALKLAGINSATLPATRPVLLDSSSSITAWQRERLNAMDERDLIDAQISSVRRIHDHTVSEAEEIRDVRINHAKIACNRETDDAKKIMEATTGALQSRQADLDRVIAGLGAAIDASGENKPDGVPE